MPLVTAVNNKVTTHLATIPIKKRKPSYGRKRRGIDSRNYNNEETSSIMYDEESYVKGIPLNTEQMYHTLIALTEGYVKFNDFYRNR